MSDRKMFVALLRRDFSFFLRFAYTVIGGEGDYKHNWHIDAIAYELERIVRGENRRLILTVPPRHLKSTTVAIAWVAWMLGRNPALRFISCSYGGDFAEKQGRDMLKILDHPLFKRAFPELEVTRRSAMDIETSMGGGRLSTSLGGTLTGRGADYIIVDDPTKSREASSQAIRDSDREWLENTLMTRLNDPSSGSIILVMQRLHEGDLVGVLREKGGWHELKLPAIAQADEKIAIGEGRYYLRREGHVLHAGRVPLETLFEMQREMGTYNFAAQFLQEPVPARGNLIQRDWLLHYDPVTLARKPGQIIQSWDTAGKDNPTSDYSVCVTALVRDGVIYVLDVFRARLAFPQLRDHAIRLAREHGVDSMLVEDASSGTQLIQTLRSGNSTGVPWPIARKVETDKVSRVAGISSMIEAGQLRLPADAPWLAEFIAELLGFPNSRHDDQVDALSQLLIWVRDGYDEIDMVYGPLIPD